jgi:DNA-3-methyladenine glycosylase II
MTQTLTEHTFKRGLATLVGRDHDLAKIVAQWGEPPFWIHPSGFPGLVLAILSQQVSIESAKAAFDKLDGDLGKITPEAFSTLDDRHLREIGFSRQKTSYVRGLAMELMSGGIDLDELETLDYDQVWERLTRIRGIGPWTADCYLLFALRRADAWPSGDLALAKTIQELKGHESMPNWDEVDRFADQWRPWRAVAARILWHHYLSARGRS